MAATKTMMLFSSACMMMMIMVFVCSAGSAKADGLDCLGTFGSVISCEGFLTGKDDEPEQECCNLLQDLNDTAMKSKDDQIRICQCLEDSVKGLTLYPQRLDALNEACGVSYLPSNPDFDCSSF